MTVINQIYIRVLVTYSKVLLFVLVILLYRRAFIGEMKSANTGGPIQANRLLDYVLRGGIRM